MTKFNIFIIFNMLIYWSCSNTNTATSNVSSKLPSYYGQIRFEGHDAVCSVADSLDYLLKTHRLIEADTSDDVDEYTEVVYEFLIGNRDTVYYKFSLSGEKPLLLEIGTDSQNAKVGSKNIRIGSPILPIIEQYKNQFYIGRVYAENQSDLFHFDMECEGFDVLVHAPNLKLPESGDIDNNIFINKVKSSNIKGTIKSITIIPDSDILENPLKYDSICNSFQK